MEGCVATDVLLNYAEFQIFPSQDRYEACICYGNKVEAATSGILAQLVLHSPKIKSLNSKGSDANFKFKPLGNLSDAKWFTKSTLIRFLRIISSDIIDMAKAMGNEITELEEARKFHGSLYSKGPQSHVGSGEADSNYSNSAASTLHDVDNPTSADASKNELLRAMDLRLTALRGELTAVFDLAVGTTCSFEDIANLEKFSYYFGAADLRNCLQKLVALRQENRTGNFPGKELFLRKNDVRNDKAGSKGGNSQTCRPSQTDKPVKYSASPAKAAHIERQSSTASEESSCTDEEEQPSVERSRALIRSASPRRSASPMRRVQIGRSGSRRSTALTIKSLNYIPARERSISHKDESASDSNEEECEQTSKISDNKARRMSVQDAISLFESKQRGQAVDFQKTKSLLNVSVANKAVLRRWSSGVCEGSNSHVDVASDDPAFLVTDNLEDQEIASVSEMKPESYPTPKSHDDQAADDGCKPNLAEEGTSSPEGIKKDSLLNQGEETSEKLNASVEWTRQKEAELNQLLMKMMETKPTKYQKSAPGDGKHQSLPNERRGGFYDHYKEKRDEKLRGETARKREKEKQFKALQQILDVRKGEMVSGNVSNISEKPSIKRTHKTVKKLPESENPRNVSPKPAVAKKTSSKSSQLPATRKSLPSTPSPRTAGVSPAKSPSVSAGTTPTRRRSQPATAAPRSSQKVDTLQPLAKFVKAPQKDIKKSVKNGSEKNLQTVTKTSKPKKPKVQPASEDSAKVRLSKVTRKSSVVPLESKESKPFLRKGKGSGTGSSPVTEAKISSQPDESLRVSVDLVQVEENEMASVSSGVNQVQDGVLEDPKLHKDKDKDFRIQAKTPQKCEDTEGFDTVTSNDKEDFGRIEASTLNTETEGESNISPRAWVEIEEHEDQSLPCNGDLGHNESLADVAPVSITSPRVRHSLSQMLLEDNSDPDVSDGGNAENPPTMVYQKDVPKGLKRLLKFARKSKTDANSTGFSSPSVFSEGEDDPEDSNVLSKRSSDNLLKKATLHAKNAGQQKSSSSEAYELSAQTSIGEIAAQKFHEGRTSASTATTKATRSFFSLSAFKGSKQNDAKLR